MPKNTPNSSSKTTKNNPFGNLVEFVRSKIDKKYVLSDKSPQFLKNNKTLILKTLSKNPSYLNQVPDKFIREELWQKELPENGILATAFKAGYVFDENSHHMLLGKELGGVSIDSPIVSNVFEDLQRAIIYYLNNYSSDTLTNHANVPLNNIRPIVREFDKPSNQISSLIENLSPEFFLESELSNQLIEKAVECGYKLTDRSPSHLKEIPVLAENYYRDLLLKDKSDVIHLNILNPKLLNSQSFLENYIQMLKNNGFDEETVLTTLTQNSMCVEALKQNSTSLQTVFKSIAPTNIPNFFDKIFSNEELNAFLLNNNELQGGLLRLSHLYSKDNTILSSIDGRLLTDKYENIPDYKMQIIAKNPSFQEKLLSLDDFKYSLYDQMSNLISQKTERWNWFELNIVNNLSDGFYDALLDNLTEHSIQGEPLSAKELEILTNLFSKTTRTKSHFEKYVSTPCKERGYSEEQIEQLRVASSNNIFNITTKNELLRYEEIRELVCDTVLANPSLNNEQLTASVQKHLACFAQLPEIDRIKLALLEKTFNISLEEARTLTSKFAKDLDHISTQDTSQLDLVEQLSAIKNICECNDPNLLQQIGSLNTLVQTDLATSTYLHEQATEMFEDMFKKDLFVPKDEDLIETVTYLDKKINVYNCNPNFKMFVKRVKNTEQNAQELWNKTTGFDDNLRYYTCTSYMTGENLLNLSRPYEVTFGFSQSLKDCSFVGMHHCDVRSQTHGGDDIHYDFNNNQYVTPDTLETNTDDRYNEVIVNTLTHDESGQIVKIQPDYIVYIKEKSDMTTEELESDVVWENSKKMASEFGIPIVVIDREQVKENERSMIETMSQELGENPSAYDALRFVKKVEHYTHRYGSEDIMEFAPEDKISSLKDFITFSQAEEQANPLTLQAHTGVNEQQLTKITASAPQEQVSLAQGNVIAGEQQ